MYDDIHVKPGRLYSHVLRTDTQNDNIGNGTELENAKQPDDAVHMKGKSEKGHNEETSNAGSDSRNDSMWISHLRLHKEQEAQLLQGMWLDDAVINGAQTLLKRQIPNISGFQSTQVVVAKKADMLGGGAIQIMHKQMNYWVCLHVKEDRSGVRLFDSLYS